MSSWPTEVVARAAHDLRVPLATLAGTVETLAERDDDLTPEQRAQLIVALRRSTRRVAGWVNALLEGALADEQDPQPQPHPVDLGPLLAEAAELASAATAGLVVEVPQTDLRVNVDPGLVIRTLTNLLANAGHHAAEGGRVELRVREEGGDDDTVAVAVVDHGQGFDREALERLRLGADARWRGGAGGAGLGLGLPSARALVRSWGGILGVDATPGGGATVWFTVPRVTSTAEDAPAQEPGKASGRAWRTTVEDGEHAVRWTVVDPDPGLLTSLRHRNGASTHESHPDGDDERGR